MFRTKIFIRGAVLNAKMRNTKYYSGCSNEARSYYTRHEEKKKKEKKKQRNILENQLLVNFSSSNTFEDVPRYNINVNTRAA